MGSSWKTTIRGSFWAPFPSISLSGEAREGAQQADPGGAMAQPLAPGVLFMELLLRGGKPKMQTTYRYMIYVCNTPYIMHIHIVNIVHRPIPNESWLKMWYLVVLDDISIVVYVCVCFVRCFCDNMLIWFVHVYPPRSPAPVATR